MSPAPHKGKKPARIFMVLAMLFVAGLVVAGAFGDVGSGLISSSGSTETTTDSSSASTTDATPTTTTADTTTTESTTTTAPVYSPTISSDKADYAPGQTVTLTGGAWQAGEAVHIFVNDDIGQTWSYSADVTANDAGGFVASFALPTSFVATYAVTATGTISGTAKTSFTDGNVKFDVAPTGSTAQFVEHMFSTTNCSGTEQTTAGFPKTLANSAGDTVGVGQTQSVRIDAAATSDQGGAFQAWSSTDSPASPFTVITATGGKSICIPGFQSGNRNYRATYATPVTNSAPTVAADNASRTVNEGATATNTGTYSDPDAGDNVAITASVGSVTKTGTNSGTWSWSFGTTDGPAQSQTVTITANDGNGHIVTTTFGLTVNNVAPTATFNAPASVNEGSSISLSLTSPSDPSTVDTAAGFQYAFDCGTGSGYGAFGATSTASCPTTDDGSRTVKGEIKDKDGGITEYTQSVTISNVAPTATLSNNGPIIEGGSATVSFSSPSDPSSADTAAGFHYSFACNGNAASLATTYAGAGTATSTSCSFADQGTFPVLGRIFDKDNGSSTFTTNVVVTNANPVVTAPANQSSNEGSSASFSLGTFSDAGVNDSPWLVDVNWGDGGPHTNFSNGAAQGSLGSQSHTYADSGSYTVTLTVTDKDSGSGSAQFTVTVANVAPTATLSNDGPVTEGSPATISFSGQSDPSSADTAAGFHYAYACDNGSLAGATYAGSGTSASTTCTFNDNGSHTVRARIIDKDGGFSEYQTTVAVTNANPVVTAPANQSANEGESHSFSLGTFSDAGVNDSPWLVDVDWGDASPHTSFSNGAAQGSLGSKSHTYADNGSYTVTVTVTDKDGGSGQAQFTVAVANVAPTATLSNDGPISEGGSATISFSGQSDPSSGDAAAGFHYAYSCTTGDLSGATYAGSGSSDSTSCSFADNGTFPVKARIIDKDGGFSEYTTNVIVNNVAPSVTAAASQSSDEGAAHSFDLGSFSDAGANDGPWSVDVDWGDGSPHTTFSAASQGALGSKSHTYDDNTLGGYTVVVKVTDKDGGFNTASFDVDVHNVAPSAAFSNDGPVNEGSDFHLFLSTPSDPSGADTSAGFEYAFDCGSGYGAFSGSPSATCSTTDNGVRSVKGKIRDKDGGVSEYTASVTVNNVNPVVQAAADQSSNEGAAHSFSLGSFNDPGTSDGPWSVDVDWGDGSPHSTFSAASQGSLGSQSHTYADNGSYTVSVSVTDKDGGSGSASFTATVANVAPSVTAAAGQSSDEGESHSFGLGSFSDPGAGDSPWHVVVDWGDGHSDNFNTSSQGSLGSLAHTYQDNGSYSVSVSVTDKDGATGSAGFTASVANVAPSVNAASDQGSDEGENHSFSLGTFSDPGVNDSPWLVNVSWGDGSPDTSFSNGAAQGSLGSRSHTYADNGTYTVTVSVTDKDGGVGSAQFKVTVANVAPSVTAPAGQSSDEGASHSFSLGSFSDPGAGDNPWDVSVDWGDGSPDTPLAFSSQGSLGSTSHTYADNGSYTATVTVTDKDGASGQAQFSVAVANVAPTADLSNGGPANEGSPVSVSFSNPHDASSADTSAGFHYAFDCNGGSLAGATYGGSGTSDSTSCTFDDNGTYPVTGRIIDKDGGSTEYTTNVIVNNVAPSVIAAANQSSDEGASHSFDLGSFSDPGADSPWSVDVDWGDGSAHTTFSSSPGPLGSKSHAYDDNGAYTVKVTVTDKDGGSGSAQFTANVANVAPSATFSNDGPVSEGSDFHLFLSGPSDPSGADTSAGFEYAFDCGSGYGAFSGTPSATCSTSDNGVRSVKGKIRDKDGGVSEYTAGVTVNNVNPVAQAAADQSSDEGESHSFGLGSFADPGADSPWAVDVDWGDGSSHTTFSKTATGSLGSQSHSYADNGSYTVTVKVTDKDGGYGSATFKVTVANVPPAITAPADQNGTEGTSASFNLGSFTDPGPDGPWAVDVAWGDGSPHTTLNAASTGSLGTKPHTYADNGVYTVSVSVTDKDGGSDSKTFKVTVANASPVVTAPADQAANEGASTSFNLGSFSDAGANDNPWSVDVDWGDGSPHATFSQGTQGSLGSQSHTYANNGAYTVTVKVTDKDGGSGQATFKANVANVPPSVTAPADQSSTEGASTSFTLGSFTDPGPDSPWAVDVDWGDSSAHTTFSQSATGSLGSQSHTYRDNGVYTVTVKVTDNDKGSGQATFKVSVSNVPPAITAFTGTTTGLAGPLVFTAPVTFNGTFKDPGLIDNPWSGDWSWDGVADAGAHQTYPANGTDTHNFTQTHQYTSPGCNHTASVKIADKDGGYDTKTITVGVGSGAFLPPVTNTPVTNKLKNGQVLPVKIQITDCNGAGVNNLSPSIRLVAGDTTSVADDSIVQITPTSTSAADTTGVMRSAGSDGSYIYNMNVNLDKLNTDYTIVVYPYGGSSGPSLKHVIQATK